MVWPHLPERQVYFSHDFTYQVNVLWKRATFAWTQVQKLCVNFRNVRWNIKECKILSLQQNVQLYTLWSTEQFSYLLYLTSPLCDKATARSVAQPQIINPLKLLKEIMQFAFFFFRAPDFQNITAFYDGSKTSPNCPSNKHHEDNYGVLVER